MMNIKTSRDRSFNNRFHDYMGSLPSFLTRNLYHGVSFVVISNFLPRFILQYNGDMFGAALITKSSLFHFGFSTFRTSVSSRLLTVGLRPSNNNGFLHIASVTKKGTNPFWLSAFRAQIFRMHTAIRTYLISQRTAWTATYFTGMQFHNFFFQMYYTK